MNADPTAGAGGEANGPGNGPGQPGEEELRAAYEAELSRITSTDMMAQTAVSLLNIAARRLGPPPGSEPSAGGGADSAGAGRDLEQVRDALDGVKALLDILERRIPQELRSLRDALSQLQMAYAREIQVAGRGSQAPPSGGEAGGGPERAPANDTPASGAPSEGPGPAQSSGRLWVPGQ